MADGTLKTVPNTTLSPADRLLNREISWLAFNQRVLEEALNPYNPLLERVRFLSIAASNQEEFFMVRVAGLKSQSCKKRPPLSPDGLTPAQQLKLILEVTTPFAEQLLKTWKKIKTELKEQGINIVKTESLTDSEKKWAKRHFMVEIFPLITPVALDSSQPFPFVSNKSVTLALGLNNRNTSENLKTLIILPPSLKRFVHLPGKEHRLVMMEDFILLHLDLIFPLPLEYEEHVVFSILRDADMEVDDKHGNLVETVGMAINRRKHGKVIRLTVNDGCSEKMKEFLTANLQLANEDILSFGDLIGLADIRELTSLPEPKLLFKPFEPRYPERIDDFGDNCFAAIKSKDILLHHPYKSFEVFVDFLQQAAHDPDVVSIKQTIYRTNSRSAVVESLIEAARNGKAVTAVVEIKARFDEEANLRWAVNMEKAGVQVVFGILKLKTHAKVSLVTRREGQNLQHYAHFGTGNYNTDTAKIYSDLSLFTSDPGLCRDAAVLFNYMTALTPPVGLKHLTLAPFNLRETLIALIQAEELNAKKNRPSGIWLKCNGLADPDIIEALYSASQAGVNIQLIVRGICKLRPQVPGLSENITVKSIVGRFLEHARIYCFAHGRALPSREAKVFIASADLMRRNLGFRIETMVPILNETVHKQVLDEIMVANLMDTAQSWYMNADGTYTRKKYKTDAFSAHNYFLEHPSLSGRGKASGKKN